MSVCHSGPADDDAASEEFGASARDAYKEKPASKIVRVFTVLAYLLLVSLGAILLSVYYVCVWKSPELPPINATEEKQQRVGVVNARTGNLSDYVFDYHEAGGGNSTVNGTITISNTTSVSTVPYPTDATTLPTDITTDVTDPSTDTVDGLSNSSAEPTSSYSDTESVT